MQKKLLAVALFLTGTFIFSTNAEPKDIKAESSKEISISKIEADPLSEEEEISARYEVFSDLNAEMPALETFSSAMKGYNKLVEDGEIKKQLLSIVDFSLPSTEKRMWILDMKNNKVLKHTYVAHGRNTGGNMATKFSNRNGSNQSSLGFYVTGETYYGKNGLSLFIDGKEKGFNSRARQRYVVIHGADYAESGFIKRNGRLGRSLGCPAVPNTEAKELINTIKGKSAVFVYYPSKDYLQKSEYLNAPAV